MINNRTELEMFEVTVIRFNYTLTLLVDEGLLSIIHQNDIALDNYSSVFRLIMEKE